MRGIQFPKKEYRSKLIVDCNGKIERERCLVRKDTKEQKSLMFNRNFVINNIM